MKVALKYIHNVNNIIHSQCMCLSSQWLMLIRLTNKDQGIFRKSTDRQSELCHANHKTTDLIS